MPKFIVHSELKYELFKVVEAANENSVEVVIQHGDYDPAEYQKCIGESILTISPCPEDYDLHTDATDKGFF